MGAVVVVVLVLAVVVVVGVLLSKRKSSFTKEAEDQIRVKKSLMKKSGPVKQKRAKKWIVLDLGFHLPEDFGNEETYRLKFHGECVQHETSFSLPQLRQMASSQETTLCDWHCVTGWSYHGIVFDKVLPLKDFLSTAHVSNDWTHLVQHSADGYSTCVFREDIEDDAFLTFDLDRSHGIIRLVCPKLFGWKSAKFVSSLEFCRSYKKGFWEKLGCHDRGRWELDERWQSGLSSYVWPFLVSIQNTWDSCGLYQIMMDIGAVIVGTMVNKKVISK